MYLSEKIPFELLSWSERAHIVSRVMQEGYSNYSAARLLHTTPGAIASTRWKCHIPSKNPPPDMQARKKPEPPIRKIAASESVSCRHLDEKRRRCPFEPTHGGYCIAHKRRKKR